MAPVVKPRTIAGAMELLPREQARFQWMLDTIRSTYECFGFVGIDTPAIELVEVLLTKSGGDTEKQVYLVQSTGGRALGHDPDRALRFDLTVPLARYVAQHEKQLVFPFRRYQLAKVYRGESAQRGRYREFYQCDIDIVGREKLGLQADAEIPAVISSLFRRMNIGSFTIRMSNRKLLQGLLQDLEVEDAETRASAIREIDKLDKIGLPKVLTSLRSSCGLDESACAKVQAFLEVKGPVDQVLDGLQGLGIGSDPFEQGISELRAVTDDLVSLGVPAKDFEICTSIARGLDYYTGTIYETVLDDYPDVGSICSGGRYEDLAGLYTKSRLPGVGISIGATRLFYQLREIGLLEEVGAGVQVLLAEVDPDLRPEVLSLASTLRQAGIRTVVWGEGKKMKKQFSYADRTGIPFVVILGGDELKRDVVKVKSLATGDQAEVSRTDLVGHLSLSLSA